MDHYWKKFLDGDLNNTDVGIDGLQIGLTGLRRIHYTLIEEEIESSEKYQKEIIKKLDLPKTIKNEIKKIEKKKGGKK